MNARLFAFFIATLLFFPISYAQIPSVAESYIDGDVPEAKDFKPFLVRDLTTYLKRKLGEGVIVDYELLRDVPTQVGVASPKFYLWLKAIKPDKTVIEGAARVAALDKKEFNVTTFLTRDEIRAKPDDLARIFPKALIEKIRAKAGIQ